MKPYQINILGWSIVLLVLVLCLLALSARAADTQPTPTSNVPTVQILERVVPRACLLSVQLEDPSKCHIKSISLSPTSECRGDITKPLVCTGFLIEIDGPGCKYTATRRKDCEDVNVKKVPARQDVEPK